MPHDLLPMCNNKFNEYIYRMSLFNINRGRGKGRGGMEMNQHLGVRGEMVPRIYIHFNVNSHMLRELFHSKIMNLLGMPQN